MDLKLKEVANLLGKSERQIRYMIKKGELKAIKKDGQWSIDRECLPFSVKQILTINRKREIFTDGIDKVVNKLAIKKEYTFTDLRSFQLSYALYREFLNQDGQDGKDLQDNFNVQLGKVFVCLASGYHSFDTQDKIREYKRAKLELCQLLVNLFTKNHQKPSQPLAKAMNTIEKDIIPSINGLIRAIEKKERWKRPPRYSHEC